jgi:hypothetical protein
VRRSRPAMIAPTTRSPATRPATPDTGHTADARTPATCTTTTCRPGSTTPATATSSGSTPRPPVRSRLDRPGTGPAPRAVPGPAEPPLRSARMLAGAGRSTAHSPRRATPGTWLVAATTTPEGARACSTHVSRPAPTPRLPAR